MDPVVRQILDFVRQGPPGVASFALTTTDAGRVSVRQAGTFVDDAFTVTSVTRASALRVGHLAARPSLTWLWVDKALGHPARNVSLDGSTAVLHDRESLESCLRHREAVLGIPPPADVLVDRVLVVTTPRFLRAEGFLPDGRLVLLRDFASLTPSVRDFFS